MSRASPQLRRTASATGRERLDESFDSIRKTEKDLTKAPAWLDRPKPTVDELPPVDILDKSDLMGCTRFLEFEELLYLSPLSKVSRNPNLEFQDSKMACLLV